MLNWKIAMHQWSTGKPSQDCEEESRDHSCCCSNHWHNCSRRVGIGFNSKIVCSSSHIKIKFDEYSNLTSYIAILQASLPVCSGQTMPRIVAELCSPRGFQFEFQCYEWIIRRLLVYMKSWIDSICQKEGELWKTVLPWHPKADVSRCDANTPPANLPNSIFNSMIEKLSA